MGDQEADEPFLGTGAASATDYEGAQPSDTVSLSDSDSDDLGLADEAEVDTVSPEDPPVDDGDYRPGDTADPSDHREISCSAVPSEGHEFYILSPQPEYF